MGKSHSISGKGLLSFTFKKTLSEGSFLLGNWEALVIKKHKTLKDFLFAISDLKGRMIICFVLRVLVSTVEWK